MLYFHAVRGADAGQKSVTHAARFGRGKIFQNRTAYARCAARLTSLVCIADLAINCQDIAGATAIDI